MFILPMKFTQLHPSTLSEYQKSQEDAEAAMKGLWNSANQNLRDLAYVNDPDFDMDAWYAH